MATTILNSQKNSTGFLSASKIVDPFVPAPPSSIGKAAALKKRIINAETNANFAFGGFVDVYFPTDTHVDELYASVALGALTSGNYCAYPGLCLVDRFEVYQGNDPIVPSVSYAQLIKWMLKRKSAKEVSAILAAAGGTSFASGNVIIPLPLFFSDLLANRDQHMPMFPTHKLKNALRLRLYLRSAANVAASGATVGTPTISGNFHFWCADTNGADSLDAWDTYQSYEFESNTGTTVATGTTEVGVDLSGFLGNINHLSVSLELASDLSTAHAYMLNKQLDTIRLKISEDSHYYQAENQAQGDFDAFILGHAEGNDSTLANPYTIPIGVLDNPRVFSGALNMEKIKEFRLYVTHSEGADCQVQVMAVKNVYYKIVNGVLTKSLGAS